MADQWPHGHPDLEMWADYLAGTLAGAGVERLERHLEDCPTCRLEVKQLARFENLDADRELAAAAEWGRAREELDRLYAERLRPTLVTGAAGARGAAAVDDEGAAPIRRLPRRKRPSWLKWAVPAAAAATLAVVFFTGDARRGSTPSGDQDAAPAVFSPRDLRSAGPLRGGAADSTIGITPERPVGIIAAAPDTFQWRSRRPHSTYSLEIYTPDLLTVFEAVGIPAGSFALPDSLRSRLEPGSTYLWSVRAHDGLTISAISREVWFQISPK